MGCVEYIAVHLVDLPHGVRGFTKKNKDGSFTVMINARLSSEMQISTYDHEIKHIENGDYESKVDVDLLEKHRHTG